MAVCLTACGDDKDELKATYKANGRGLMVNWDGSTEDYFFYRSSSRFCEILQDAPWNNRCDHTHVWSVSYGGRCMP